MPIEGPPEPGAIVVLRSAGGSARSRAALLVHRVVATAESGGERLVFHRGDAGGRLGIAAAGSVVGRIVAVLDPPRRCVPALGDLDAGERRAFARAQRALSRLPAPARLGTAPRGSRPPVAVAAGRLRARAAAADLSLPGADAHGKMLNSAEQASGAPASQASARHLP